MFYFVAFFDFLMDVMHGSHTFDSLSWSCLSVRQIIFSALQDIVIGTPGRLQDMMEMGACNLKEVSFVVSSVLLSSIYLGLGLSGSLMKFEYARLHEGLFVCSVRSRWLGCFCSVVVAIKCV